MKTGIKEKPESEKHLMAAVLILVLPFCNMLPFLAMSVLMNDVMTSLSIGYSLAGLTMTVMLAVCGLCMLVGSGVQDLIGVRYTLIISVWIMFIGSAFCFVAGNFTVLFIGRLLSGIGFGISSVSAFTYMSALFTGDRRTFMITANLIVNNLASILSLSVATPLRKLTGSWNGVFGVYSVFIAIAALLWTTFHSPNTELFTAKKHITKNGEQKQQSSLVKAFKIKQFKILTACGIFTSIAINAITIFLPAFLTNEKGFDPGFSVMAANAKTLAYIIGTFAGGYIVTKSGRRKTVFQAGQIVLLVGGMMFALSGARTLSVFSSVLVGLGYMSILPAMSTIMIETINPPDPAILGGASSLINGVGQIVSLAVPPIYSYLSTGIGMSGAMLALSSPVIFSVIIGLMLRETNANIV